METPKGRYHWSNTALEAQFWKIPASASVPWLLMLFYPRMVTFYIAIALTVFFSYLSFFKKMAFMDFVRYVKVRITGRTKSTKKLFK
ncbi:hypothetical protein L1281_002491 [Neisseria sp. HSC-16F19]|nr:IcmT/TraK family protein [Neisseria sp. HSC-16F19]MCP2041873.1 hypothetical protein [Neisseria sp. HSC-16F19]